MLIQFVVRTIGPILLRGGLGGGNTASTSNKNNVDDDFDDFDNDDDDNNEVDDKSKDKVNISLPTFAPEKADASTTTASSATSTSQISTVTESARINLLDSDDFNQSTSTVGSQTTEDDFSFR